jgi:flagellar biosynthetic protein FliR
MNLFNFSQPEIISFMVVLIRVSAMMVWFPIFGDKITPPLVKILFSFVISLIVFPIVRTTVPPGVGVQIIPTVILIAQEIFVGVLMGIMSKAVFYAISFGAQVISFQMGFGIVGVVDPNLSTRVSIINQFQVMVATLLFLIINGHYVFFESLVVSYKLVAPGTLAMTDSFFKEIMGITSMIFVVGFKMAAPIAAVLLVVNTGFGMIARAVPQMNVFMITFPVSISIGFIFLGLTLPLFTNLLGVEFNNIGDNILKILKTI